MIPRRDAQFFNGASSLVHGGGQVGGFAFQAHVGGLAAGTGCARRWLARRGR